LPELIIPILPRELIAETKRAAYWLQLVSELDMYTGTGSPEGVVAAKQKRFYMDEAGAAGAVLYIKRDADVGGNRSLGWIAV
jgi:hypothetical protein